MLPDKSAFISYRPVTGCRAHMGNNSFAHILGLGSAVISVNGRLILMRDCLHILALCNPLYSLRAHQPQDGCGLSGCTALAYTSSYPHSLSKLTPPPTATCHMPPLDMLPSCLHWTTSNQSNTPLPRPPPPPPLLRPQLYPKTTTMVTFCPTSSQPTLPTDRRTPLHPRLPPSI